MRKLWENPECGTFYMTTALGTAKQSMSCKTSNNKMENYSRLKETKES